ncbi:MAG: SIMPL domain-containing protein [Candidatus Paceibacterales bacterium]
MEVETELETNHIIDFSDRLFSLAVAAIVVGAVFLAGYVFYQFNALPQNTPHEISVSGDGKAYAKPDVALVSFGVTTQAPKSQDAVNQNNTKMNAVIAAIKSAGVDDKDIQTTLYNLSPVYSYPVIYQGAGAAMMKSGAVAPSMPIPVRSGPTVTGYSLEQQISVKIRNFDNINSILDKATAAGATNVGSLQFAIDNPEKVQADARAQAIAKAKEKLQSIVDQSGLQIGKLVNISEGYNNYPQPMYAAGLSAKDSTSVAPQIQTGQQEVDSTVTLTYQVK